MRRRSLCFYQYFLPFSQVFGCVELLCSIAVCTRKAINHDKTFFCFFRTPPFSLGFFPFFTNFSNLMESQKQQHKTGQRHNAFKDCENSANAMIQNCPKRSELISNNVHFFQQLFYPDYSYSYYTLFAYLEHWKGCKNVGII